jgi:hypothetical protein
MVKEEWRIHSTMMGSLSFAMFPFLIFGIAFMSTFLLSLIQSTVPAGSLAITIHVNYLMLGFMVGAFGLIGNEVMNRRFGQASLISYAARSLPLSGRRIFFTFVVKDIVYYFFLWVFPFWVGFALASPWTSVPLSHAFLLLVTLTLAFLYGLCLVFFLSALYARAKTAFWVILAVIAAALSLFWFLTGTNPAYLFPPITIYTHFAWPDFLGCCALVSVLLGAAVLLFDPESRSTENMYAPLVRHLSSPPRAPLAAKDLLDVYRSGGIVGQTFFSFFIPLVVIWFFLSLPGQILPAHGLIMVFAIVTGVIASTMYTWVTMFDSFGPYATLPVPVSTVISGKISTFSLLQILPASFIAGAAILSGEVAYLVPAVVLCLSVSFYVLGVTIWLTGLSPNVLVYDVRVLVTYMVLVGIALTTLSGIVYASPWNGLAAVALAVPAWLLIRKGKAKWDAREETGY